MSKKSGGVPQGGLLITRPAPIVYHNGFVQGYTLLSDLHIGARNVDYALIKEELETAKRKKDRILINGDVFDMILSCDKKRFRPDVLHPRLVGKPDIVNSAIEWGAELLGPYADLIDLIGCGNHESSLEKYHNIDVIKILVHELRKMRKNKNHQLNHGGFTGYYDARFRDSADNKNRHGKRFVIYYHHGAGGSAPVTKGIIDFHRKGWIQADVILLGHKHNKITSVVRSMSCPIQGNETVVKDVYHIMTGSYMTNYATQTQGSLEEHGRIAPYASDWGLPEQSKGCARIELEFFSTDRPYKIRVIQ